MAAMLPKAIVKSDVWRISHPRSFNVRELEELTSKAEFIAEAVARHWEAVDPGVRERLRELAYNSIEPSRQEGKLSQGVAVAATIFKGEHRIAKNYLAALDELTTAVLYAIERENLDHRAFVTELVNEGTQSAGRLPTVTSDEFDDWLAGV